MLDRQCIALLLMGLILVNACDTAEFILCCTEQTYFFIMLTADIRFFNLRFQCLLVKLQIILSFKNSPKWIKILYLKDSGFRFRIFTLDSLWSSWILIFRWFFTLKIFLLMVNFLIAMRRNYLILWIPFHCVW